MRIEIQCVNDKIASIPINYQYYLTSAIYKAINMSDKVVAEELHDLGFGEQRKLKLFTYSYLKGDCFKVRGNDLMIVPGTFKWAIGSPIQKLLDLIIEGFVMQGELEIKKIRFPIESIKLKSVPRFKNKEYFICNSPIVVSKKDKNRIEYLTCINNDFIDRINNNLIRKYEILFNERYEGKGVRIRCDKKYPYTKLIKYKDIKIKGVFDRFELMGDSDLIHIAYEAGIGEKNSMGFGMIERSFNYGR